MDSRGRFAAVGLVAGLLVLSGAAPASARWLIQTTEPSLGDTMTAVSCQAGMCMAVMGQQGAAGSERWNGHSWSLESVPDPAHGVGPEDNFAGVSCP